MIVEFHFVNLSLRSKSDDTVRKPNLGVNYSDSIDIQHTETFMYHIH